MPVQEQIHLTFNFTSLCFSRLRRCLPKVIIECTLPYPHHFANFSDGMLFLVIYSDCQLFLVWFQLLWPPSMPAPGPGRCKPRLSPLPYQMPLELSQRTKDVKDQPSSRSCRVDTLCYALQADS